MEPTPRRAARLLIIDADSGAVLLFQYEDAGRRWWATPVEFTFRGTALRQDEQYFLLRLSPGDVALEHVQEAHRHEGILATRWWTLEEIETTSEQVFPEDLLQRLRDLRSPVRLQDLDRRRERLGPVRTG